MSHMRVLALLACLVASAFAQEESRFVTDPNSPELQALAKPMVVDEAKYGCGPLREPGKTYYVSVRGDDKADGLSWPSAWRSVRFGVAKLKAGDTLIIGEGEYCEDEIQINVQETSHAAGGQVLPPQLGEPGRPIRIMAAPRHRVVLTGARTLRSFQKSPGTNHTFESACTTKVLWTAWESDTQIMLQAAGSVERVDELPGTCWLDTKAQKLYVRFSDSRGPEAHSVCVRGPRVGLRIHGSYVHVKGLTFVNYGSALYARPNEDKEKNLKTHGDHITVEDCAFFANDMAGLHVSSVKWCLFKGNYGEQNGERGSILTQNEDMCDNLLVGNVCHSSAATIRSQSGNLFYGVNHYGGLGARNHLIGNVINDRLSFRWKPVCKQTTVQGNVMTGSFYCTGTRDIIKDKADRVVLRNNVILGRFDWGGEQLGTEGPGTDWTTTAKAFVNNFAPQSDRKAIEAARFADPAYDDYRLQSDSPLIGQALGGGDRGAFRTPAGRILYVGPKGDDAATGTSERLALKTLGKAATSLKAGDTLYVLPGSYAEPLAVNAPGSESSPIWVRAHGRGRVSVPSITVAGAQVAVEGFSVDKAQGDGITVKAANVTLRHCRVRGSTAAGIRALAARNLSVLHCTLADNAVGLALRDGSTNAMLRDSIIAGNRATAVEVASDSKDGYLVSHNCYVGPGLDKDRVAAEMRSIIADPLFVAPAKDDCKLAWNSPAAFLGLFSKPAGSEAVGLRPIEIADVKVSGVLPDSAVVTWRTPMDDTIGYASCRPKGQAKWETVRDAEQGTVHGAGVVGLKPDTEYEFRVSAEGRRGGGAQSAILTARTPTQSPPPAKYYLSPKGDDNADGKSPQTAWRSIRKACLVVGPGDTVLIAPGVYQHAIIPFKSGLPGRPITFKREGEGVALMDGGGVVAPLVHLIGKKCVTVDGLTFDGIPEVGAVGGAFQLQNCEKIEILNCRVGHQQPTSWRSGRFVAAGGCKGLRIEGNVSWGTDYHLWLSSCSDTLLKNNTFVNATQTALVLDGRGEGFTILNNLWYRPCIPDKSNMALLFRIAEFKGVVSDYNLFFSPHKNHKVGVVENARREVTAPGDHLAQWQQTSGYDKHSVQADPMFADVEKGDFRLRPGSPAIGKAQGGGNIGACGVAK